jgi:hypothetical protein
MQLIVNRFDDGRNAHSTPSTGSVGTSNNGAVSVYSGKYPSHTPRCFPLVLAILPVHHTRLISGVLYW